MDNMNTRLREYIDGLFANAPKTKQIIEIKEEILQNTLDRYNDLIAEGKSEEAAFNISVAGIGDVEHLIDSVKAPVSMSGYSKDEIENNRRTRAKLLSIAVALYICSVIPPMIAEEIVDNETIGVVFMFIMIAVATSIIIYRNSIKLPYNKNADTVVEDFKEWNSKNKEQRAVLKSIHAAVSCLTLVIYFVISFSTGAWYITWLTFLIGGAVNNVITAIYDLVK